MNVDLPTTLLQSLGWALAHSIWQITVFALVLAFVLPRLASARGRYWLALITLFSAFIVFIATFIDVTLNKLHTVETAVYKGSLLTLGSDVVIKASAKDLVQSLSTWLEDHAVVVVLFWVAGFAISLFRLFGGLYYLHRLQRVQVGPASSFWQNKVDSMCQKLHLSRPAVLLESALVHSPLAWGYFKPLIFFPLGLLNQLSAAEVESILAHELAHIARRDWLFNLMQALVEACFYYHPAAWWISSIICAERENCCDDAAVQLTGDRYTLAKALLHLQQLSAPNVNVLALGAQGQKKLFHRFTLLTRIQRILNQPSPQKYFIMEKFVATTLLLGVLTLIGIRANQGQGRLEAANTVLSETAFAWFGLQPDASGSIDSVPKPPHRMQKIVREDDGKRVEMDLKDGQVTRLNIDGREIPSNEWAQHQALTNEVLRDMEHTPPPPLPPVPGMPPMPPMPPMTPMTPMTPMPPIPPMTPMNSHRLSTGKDAEGNTLIHLERAGKPVDITVKNGEVWVDGKRVADGESLEIQDLSAPIEMTSTVIIDDQGRHIMRSDKYGENVIVYQNDFSAPEVTEQVEMQIERRREMATENKNLSEKNKSKQEKAFQKAEKEMRKAELELQKQQLKLEEQQRKLQDERRSINRGEQ